MTRTALSGVIITVLVVSSAHAQQIEAPARASGITRGERPVDQQRNRKEVTAQLNVMGGYDDNLSAESSSSPFAPRNSGYIGAGTGLLRYFAGRDRHSIDISGRGLVHTYESVGSTYGGGIDAIGQTMVGRTEVNLQQTARTMPFFALGAFGALTERLGPDSPDSNPSNGLSEQRSFVSDSTATVRRQWTRAFSSDANYSFDRQTYNVGTAFDSRTQSGSVGIERLMGRGTRIRSSYRYADSEHSEANGRTLPETDHNVDVGFEHSQNLSRTRRLLMSVGAGGLHVDTLNSTSRAPLQYWTPSGRGSLQYDFGGTWSVSGDYRRGLSVLNGLRPTSFISDTASARAGGLIGERIESAFVFGYGNGQAGDNVDSDYHSYTGSAQVRVRVTHGWSWLVNINHYEYRLSESTSLLLGVPQQVKRNSVWTGVTWYGPLYRRYSRGTPR